MNALILAAALLAGGASAAGSSSRDIKTLEREARANPGSPQALLNLGWAYWHARETGKAWTVGSTLMKLDPSNVAFMIFMANTELERGRHGRAIALMNRALELAPGDKAASMVLARALARAKREEEAVALLDRLEAEHPNDASIPFLKASLLAEAGRKMEGLELVERLLAAEPGNAAYRRERAKILRDLDRTAEAKAEWQSLTRNRRDANSLLNLGWLYWREGSIAEARAIASTLLKLDPRNPTFLRFMANMEIEAMNYAEALRLAEAALEAAPGDRDASLTRAKALFRLQREKEGVEVLKALIAKHPGHQAVQYQWAEALARMGKYDEALAYFDRLVERSPSNVRYQYARAAALYDKGRFPEAVSAWAELSRASGDPASIRRLRDDAFNRRAWLEAASWQEKVIGLKPADPAGWERLSMIYSAMHRYSVALMAAEKAIAVDPAAINGYYLKAEALERLEDWDAALKAYEEIVRRNPNSIRAFDGLSYVHEARKAFEPAVQTLHQIAARIEPTVSPYLRVREARMLADSGRYGAAQRLLAAVIRGRERAIPVLLYHGISRFDRSDSLPQSRFREQMAALKRKGYQSMTVGELERAMRGEAELPDKPVLITFDDARTDSFENADPVLEQFGYRATMFVHLSKLRKTHFHASPEDIIRWEATGRWEMQAHGTQAHDPMVIDAAGHKGHFLPNRMWLAAESRSETLPEYRARVEADYAQSRRGVEEIVKGRSVTAFAYPYGDYGQNDYSNNPESTRINQELVRKYFRLAFVQEQYGVNFLSSNPTDLRRFAVPKYMTGDQLTAHLALADPWVQAKLVEAQMWVEANQPGRGEAVYAELEREGLDEPRLWADKGAAFEKAGDLYRARALFARADEFSADKDSLDAARYARQRDHGARAAAPALSLETQSFSDSETNVLFKALARASAQIQRVRLELYGGQGWYDDRRDPSASPPRIRGREAGAALRWFPSAGSEVDGFYTRREFSDGFAGSADVYALAGAWQALPQLSLALRDGMGDVETAAGIRAGRKFHADGAGAAWDPALNWKVNLDYDRSRYNDDNIEHDARARATRRLSDSVSLGAAYFRGDSSRPSPEYYTPRRLNQFSGIATLSRSFGAANPRTGLRRADAVLQYEAGYGFQPNGSRAVHSLRAGASLRVLDAVSLTLGGQYSQSPSYVMRRVDAGVVVVFWKAPRQEGVTTPQ
jgi:tetratricopeptide (TPR) repeat protein